MGGPEMTSLGDETRENPKCRKFSLRLFMDPLLLFPGTVISLSLSVYLSLSLLISRSLTLSVYLSLSLCLSFSVSLYLNLSLSFSFLSLRLLSRGFLTMVLAYFQILLKNDHLS